MRYRLLLVLLLIGTLVLAACGQQAAPPPAEAPPADTAPEPTPETDAPAAEEPTEATETEVTEPEATEPAEEPAATDPAPAAGGTVRIAIMGPFTGGAASIGQEQLNFARLALENFNAENGTNYELVESDTELDPANALTEAERLAADPNIFAVIGPAGSQEVIAAGPVLTNAGLAFVSPSATRPDLTEGDLTTFFRVVPRDDVQGPTAANFMIDELGAANVWIIDDQTAYSTGLAEEVEAVLQERGVTFTRESISQNDSDFSALVTRIGADAPDVVFIPWQLAPQGALLSRQMAEQGVTATIFGADGQFSADEFIDGAAGATEGAYVSFFAPDVSTLPDAQDIVAQYEDRHGTFGPFGAPAYAATLVVLEAVQRAEQAGELTREAVLAEIPNTSQPSSILGIPISFDDNGDIEGAAFYLFQVQNDAFVLVE